MTQVRVRPGEPVERALRNLKKQVDREGILKAFKSRRFYEKPSVRRRLKSKNAKRYNR